MAFIKTIPDSEINDDVRAMYQRQKAHYGFVPNYARVFCYRPEIMQLWAQLQLGIKHHMDRRRFELLTFVAAHTLRSTLCSLAHGKALTKFFSAEDVMAIARGEAPASLSAAEAAMLVFARKVTRDASAVVAEDIAELKRHGFVDAEIFDISAAVAARAFWTKVIESLGVEAEAPFRAMGGFSRALAVGRPVDFPEPQLAQAAG